jgi:hypothetical protein
LSVSTNAPSPNVSERRVPYVGRGLAEIALVLVLCTTAGAVLYRQADSQPFSVDESRWIATSRYFWITFVDRDVFGPDWQPNYLVFTHPPVARYLLGLGLALQGWTPEQLNGRYDTDRSRDFNRRAGNIPGPDLLHDARAIAVLFAFGALAMLYLVGRTLVGVAGGALAVLLACFHPLLGTLWTRALAESFLAFFCLLAFWLACRVATMPTEGRRRFFAAASLGIAVGLATATKLSGSLLGAGLVLYVATRQGIRWCRDRSIAGFGPWVDAGMAAVLIFVTLNPVLYPNPVYRTVLLFEHRRDEMEQQALGTPRLAIPPDFGLRAAVMFERTFRDWGLFEQRAGLPIDGPLAAVGVVVILGVSWRSVRRRDPPGPETLLLCWTVAVFGVTTATLGFDSSHYFAPPATVAVLLQAVALAWLARTGATYVWGRRPALPAANQKAR